jgi:methionyl-tRNA formyltransferase
MPSAVVFAYHNVGVRCLSVLLAHGVDVRLVLTHTDDPRENIWFGSVAQLAHDHHLSVDTPDNPNTPEVIARIRETRPDLLFSFYYRSMLSTEILAIPRLGAYNMHGSLLPKYRGRVPVNWAVIRGERETGATLHTMLIKPDAGAIAAQQAVPILPNDTALDVFNKVTVAAELALDRVLPQILNGTVQLTEQRLQDGAYFGGRKPEDGRIDWQKSAAEIHNLVRAVAPPYPGAFADLAGKRLRILRSRVESCAPRHAAPHLYAQGDRMYVDCGDGSVLGVLAADYEGATLTAANFSQLLQTRGNVIQLTTSD